MMLWRAWSPARILRNWPWVVSLLLIVLAVALGVASIVLTKKARDLEKQLQSAPATPIHRQVSQDQLDVVATLPDHAIYTRDLADFFKIANVSAIELGTIDYKVEDNSRLPFLVNRSIEFRLNDEYPRAKAFLSRVLQKLPHASLQEIRIEKKDVLTAQAAIQVKMVLLYRASPAGDGVAHAK